MKKKLSIIIPVYNEEKTLVELVTKVACLKLPRNYEKEIIITDDGSKDNTQKLMKELSAEYPFIRNYYNKQNLGKSQTVRRGILKSTGDFLVIQDADLEYEPSEISDMLMLAIKQDLDVVYGDRFGKKNKVIYWQNYIGNRVLSFISNLFTFPRIRVFIPDMEVCYKLIKGNAARYIANTIESISGFGFEPEVTAKLSKYIQEGNHLKFGIYPITYMPRSVKEGKHMNAYKDGFKAFGEIIKFNLSR